MSKSSLFAVALLSGLSLLFGTSSCTSKSENVSAQKTASATLHNHPGDPLTELKEGNERFYSGKSIKPNQDTVRVNELENGQHPKAVVISCSDSRVTPTIIFDQGLGDIFSIRTAGNVMDNYEEGSIEYAVEHAHAKLVVVLGHTKCGAIGAMLEHAHDEEIHGHVGAIINALKAEEEEQEVLAKGGENIEFDAVRANVVHGVKQLRNSEPVLKPLFEEGEIQIIGAIYHIETGQVEFIDI